jgi:predicted N-acetyltransferase YhbS
MYLTEDLEFAQYLTETVGWNNSIGDFERLLYYEPEGCFVAEQNGEPIGTVTITTYGKLAWVGCLIVLEDHCGKGVGSELMKHAVHYLKTRGAETIRLDAVPKAIPLYKRLGFKEEYDSLRFIGAGRKIMYRKVSKMENEDLEGVVRLDTQFFGANRERVLRRVYKDFQDLCFVSFTDEKLAGFIMAKRGLNEVKVGPWICDPKHTEAAEELLKAILNEGKGMKIWVGVPSGNKKSVNILKDYGFVDQPKSIRMYYGKRDYVGLINGVFGIGAPEKG